MCMRVFIKKDPATLRISNLNDKAIEYTDTSLQLG